MVLMSEDDWERDLAAERAGNLGMAMASGWV